MRLPNPMDLLVVNRNRLWEEMQSDKSGPFYQAEERMRVARTLLSDLLDATQDFALEYPELDRGALLESIRQARLAIANNGSNDELRVKGREVCYRLRHYAAEQEALLGLRESEVRRILDLVSGALGEFTTTSHDLTARVAETAQEMERIARLDDLRQVRAGLTKNLEQLRAALEAHSESHMATVLAEVEELRSRLNEVEQVAARDPLTSVYNRRAFDLRMEKLVSSDESFALAMCDLDGFKKLNDTHGHLLGDECLRRTAIQLQAMFRPTDMVARLGGDEFAVVIERLTPVQIAQRIRDNFAGYTPAARPGSTELAQVTCTASFGVCTRRRGESADSLIERADRCLYRAKRDPGISVVWE